MKAVATILLILSISSCYVYDNSYYNPDRTVRRYDYYYNYPTYPYLRPTPYSYYQRPSIIVIEKNNQKYVKPAPRVNSFGPTAPPSAPRNPSAPIRTFPRKDDKKDK